MPELQNIPWNLIIPILVLQLILVIVALVDLLRNKRTNGPLVMWILIIIFVNIIGPIIYFVFGRRND